MEQYFISTDVEVQGGTDGTPPSSPGRSWFWSERFARAVMGVSVFLVFVSVAVGVFVTGFLAGSSTGHGPARDGAGQPPRSPYRAAVPQCTLEISGGRFDTVARGGREWADLMASSIDVGSEGFDCVPDKDGIWSGTVTVKNSEPVPATYTLTGVITTDSGLSPAAAESVPVAVQLEPGETHTVTLTGFRTGSNA
ncbi:hypothetical protein ABH924_004826 [Arthrobacter sp. GAS37]|uniref:hypothetical protein n=1 Tax=Arthrobacter sp. GAS37 TaxID=3156261 RepID=UPI003832A7AC